jgi:putative endopeptidase
MGDNARSGYSAANFTDIPDWAKTELSNLLGTGIVAGTSATAFSPAGPMTKEQMDLMIRRVYALLGTNLKDDFYAAVNKAALDGSVIQPGYMGAGTFNDLSVKVNAQVAGIILGDCRRQNGGPRTRRTSRRFYNNVLDKAARNAAGIAPIKAYLDAIDGAQTLER